jgi:hypothetical protein
MAASVQIHSDDPSGAVRTITLTQTAADKAHIDIETSAMPGSVQSFDLKNVTGDPASITIACQLDSFFSGDVGVVVQPATAAKPPVATITVSHAFLGDGVYVYALRAGEDVLVRAFLQQAAFPPLAAGGT